MLTNVIDYGMDPQEAVEAPRWTSLPGTDPATIDNPLVLRLDHRMAPQEVERLKAKGHTVELISSRASGGSAKLIMVSLDTGVRMGGSDPRSDGHAAAL